MIPTSLALPLLARQIREHVWDDPARLPLDVSHALKLCAQEGLQLRGQVDYPALVVLRRAWVQTQRPGLEVDLRRSSVSTSDCVRHPKA